MFEPWKMIVCQNPECMSNAFDTKGKVKEEFKIIPDLDTPEVTQFTCPHCGTVETWGITRTKVAQILYSRYRNR